MAAPRGLRPTSRGLYPNRRQCFVYKAICRRADKIMDFSHAGYMGGASPCRPWRSRDRRASGGDEGHRPDSGPPSTLLAAVPLKDGFRGAVMLAQWTSSLLGDHHDHRADGVVLRGGRARPRQQGGPRSTSSGSAAITASTVAGKDGGRENSEGCRGNGSPGRAYVASGSARRSPSSTRRASRRVTRSPSERRDRRSGSTLMADGRKFRDRQRSRPWLARARTGTRIGRSRVVDGQSEHPRRCHWPDCHARFDGPEDGRRANPAGMGHAGSVSST